jgi:hypothetical protein
LHADRANYQRNGRPEDSAILPSLQLARLTVALYGELIQTEQAQPRPDCYALVEKALGAKNGVFAGPFRFD